MQVVVFSGGRGCWDMGVQGLGALQVFCLPHGEGARQHNTKAPCRHAKRALAILCLSCGLAR